MAAERRLRVDISVIKEMILREELSSLKWIPTSMQLADPLTKVGSDPTKLTAVLETVLETVLEYCLYIYRL